MWVIPAIDFTRRTQPRSGHIIRRMDAAALFVANGDPHPYWVAVKRVVLHPHAVSILSRAEFLFAIVDEIHESSTE